MERSDTYLRGNAGPPMSLRPKPDGQHEIAKHR